VFAGSQILFGYLNGITVRDVIDKYYCYIQKPVAREVDSRDLASNRNEESKVTGSTIAQYGNLQYLSLKISVGNPWAREMTIPYSPLPNPRNRHLGKLSGSSAGNRISPLPWRRIK
jgi:hypothetical protein